jgi:SseB protein N-terminal domain/SseB protein C-terminal domain
VPFWRSGRGRRAKVESGANVEGSTDAGGGQDAGREPTTVEAAMRRVAEQDTQGNRRVLFELLLGATLIAATADPPPATGEPRLVTFTTDEGTALPVFTGIDALRAWRLTGYTPVSLPGRTLFEMAVRFNTARIEVNPASVPRGWISRAEIAALAEGRIPAGPPAEANADAQAEVRIVPPPVRPPEALIEAARRALAAQPHVAAGWLFAMAHGSEPPQLMIGVELTGDIDQATTDTTMQLIVEETWARSADADRLRFIVVAPQALRDTLASGAGELVFTR